MADADALAFILANARQREVPCVISVDGRAVAFAMPPDFQLVRVSKPLPTAAEMLAAVVGTNVGKPDQAR